MMYVNTQDKKYALSITKYRTTIYTQDGIEESINNQFKSSVDAYNDDVKLGIHHWPEMCRSFYKRKMARTLEHELYQDSKIIAIVNAEVERKYGYGFVSNIKVKRADCKIYTLKEYDYKNLSFNDIEDLYLSLVIQKRVEDVQLGVESYRGNRGNQFIAYKDVYKFSGATLKKVSAELSTTMKDVEVQDRHTRSLESYVGGRSKIKDKELCSSIMEIVRNNCNG
ncbi:hypothetical protein Tco_0945948 [Tanacetum coccineum]